MKIREVIQGSVFKQKASNLGIASTIREVWRLLYGSIRPPLQPDGGDSSQPRHHRGRTRGCGPASIASCRREAVAT